MINLGLSAADMRELFLILFGSHRKKITLLMTDLNHNEILNLSKRILGGQVTFDATADIQRQLNVELFDPAKTTGLDAHDPASGSGYPTAMIRCIYSVSRRNGNRWFDIPLFWGPITKVDRNGYVLTVECSGKESLSSGALLNPISGYKGWNKGALAKSLMTRIAGETLFEMEAVKGKTTAAQAIPVDAMSLYGYVRNLLNTEAKQVFYDGRARFRVRRRPAKPVITFTDAEMLEAPQVSYDSSSLINVFEMEGATPKKAKKPIKVRVVAPPSHPLSPQSLARNGVPQYYVGRESNSDVKSIGQLRNIAQSRLNAALLQAVDVAVPTKVMPLMEEDDYIAFKGKGIYVEQRAKKWVIPLLASTNSMSVGYIANVKPVNRLKALRRP